MSDIFREVDEEVRRDKAEEFWRKYQTYFLVAAAVVVAATAGWRYWDYQRAQTAQALGARFEAALELDRGGKDAEAIGALGKIAADAPSGYRTLARLAEAAVIAKTDSARAIAGYDALAEDPSVAGLFRETARLRAAMLRLDAGQIDKAKAALEALAAPGGVYRASARELLGAVALAAQDYPGAGKWLDQVVTDPEAPRDARRAADSLLGLVGSGKPASQ